MNCPICGTNNLDNASLCINCGRPLNASAPPPPPPPPPPQSYTAPPPQGGYVPPHTPSYIPPGPPTGERIPNYLVQSILVTLCCCLPLGIVAIIFAAQVNSKLAQGDVAGARDASQKAKLFCWIGFGIGLVTTVLWMLFSGSAVFMEGFRDAMGS